MRISYSWLNELVGNLKSPEELAKEFVRTGTEVESIERLDERYDNIVVGLVLSKEPHPDSDHMSVCSIDVADKNVDEEGNPVPLQIVCGATNFVKGNKVVVAMIGAEFGDFKIKKSKLRGVMSEGMNCSLKELGLASTSEGILILPVDAPVGMPFAEYYGLTDAIIDCEITPNRPDCLCMKGIAREAAAICGTSPRMFLVDGYRGFDPSLEDLKLDIDYLNEGMCKSYDVAVAQDVEAVETPEWMVSRLEAAGFSSTNVFDDIANYTMILCGQPIRMYDFDKVAQESDKVSLKLRHAHADEVLALSDEQSVSLPSDALVVEAQGTTPIALAGISGVDKFKPEGKRVIVEAAAFDAGCVSRTSRELNLMNEASIRFERTVDPYGCSDGLETAMQLLHEICGARYNFLSNYSEMIEIPDTVIDLDPDWVRSLCGAPIQDKEISSILEALECTVNSKKKEGTTKKEGKVTFEVSAPSFRPDLIRPIDLVEEILRIWGMDRVAPTLPAARNHAGGLKPEQKRMRKIGQTLRGLGLSETKTYCFASEEDFKNLNLTEQGRGVAVEIINPLVSDQSLMRRSIVPGLLKSVSYNLHHGSPNVALYEQGRVFFGDLEKSQPYEIEYISGVMCGKWQQDTWNVREEELDFFDVKGVVEGLMHALRIEKCRYVVAEPEKYPWLQPGRAAELRVGKKVVGWLGNIHPLSLQNFDIDCDVVAFELNADALLELAQDELPYTPIPTVPGVQVDLAIVVDEEVTYEMMMQRLKSAGGKLLDSVELFDVYRDDERVGVGKKSMAFKLVYRDGDQTLTAKTVEKAHSKLVDKICKATGGEVRA